MNAAILFIFSILVFYGCVSPQVYIIDRQTMMEQEMSGEWPTLDKIMSEETQKIGPNFFPQIDDEKRQAQMKTILNGELNK